MQQFKFHLICFWSAPQSKAPFTSLLIVIVTIAVMWFAVLQAIPVRATTVAAPIVCADNGWLVADQAELDAAVGCFNSKTTTGSYVITLTQNISLAVRTTPISNTVSAVDLLVEGGGHTIDGQGIIGVRPFDIAADTDVTIQHITISRGRSAASGPLADQDGGGIRNHGTLTVSHSTLSGNSAQNDGGGILNRGTLTILNSTLRDNSAQNGGGGILNRGTLTILNSTLRDNSAQNDGGGILNFDNSGISLIVSNSTLNGNSAQVQGGGIYNLGLIQISNSTLSNNLAESGAGIYALGAISMSSSTLSGNSADSGGGIYNTGRITVSSNIIANSPSGGDCSGVALTDSGNNIVEDNSCGFTGGIDPLLGPLQDNGGPTWTHALLLDSPAIDGGSSGAIIDQRGVVRPQGAAPDIGAFELAFYDVKVARIGSGSGGVTSLLTGIDCGVTCTASSIVEGSAVTLTATADTGSTFVSWTGDVVSSTNPLKLTVDTAKNVTATFTLNRYSVVTATGGPGSGNIVRIPDAALYDSDTLVKLTAIADTGSIFTGWAGDATGLTNPLTLTVDAAKSVTATFALETNVLNVTQDGNGRGRVSSDPAGIDCDISLSTICSLTFDYGTVVTLTATADSGSIFSGWSSSDCSGVGSCTITMNESQNVTASFTTLQTYLPLITTSSSPRPPDLEVELGAVDR